MMRAEFIHTLVGLAEKDPRVVLLSGDLGYTIIEPFVEKFPGRFFNVGVAEQNMIGVATGLAEQGFIPFVYSIVGFTALRPYEFIRNGPILHQWPVRIIGIGGGFEYGTTGITHYGLEDVALMRIQKGMMVVLPCDVAQISHVLKKTWDHPGPVYYRIGKGDRNFMSPLKGQYEPGKAYLVKDGKDVALMTYGNMTKNTLEAGEILASRGCSPAVILVTGFNPSPDEDLKKILPNFKCVLTVEDHYIDGGLGSYVAEVIAENNFSVQIYRCGVRSLYDGKIGSKDFLLDKHGLSPEKIARTALEKLKTRRPAFSAQGGAKKPVKL